MRSFPLLDLEQTSLLLQERAGIAPNVTEAFVAGAGFQEAYTRLVHYTTQAHPKRAAAQLNHPIYQKSPARFLAQRFISGGVERPEVLKQVEESADVREYLFNIEINAFDTRLAKYNAGLEHPLEPDALAALTDLMKTQAIGVAHNRVLVDYASGVDIYR